MKKYFKIILPILAIVIIIICGFIYYQKTKQLPIDNSNTPVTPIESVLGTYVAHLSKDIYTLKISSQEGESIKGELDVNNFEKDSSTGTLSGTYKDGILLADYTFKSEGTVSVNQVIFKKTADGFVRGYGDVDEATGTRFVDLNAINYDSKTVYGKVSLDKTATDKIINSVTFSCPGNINIKSIFYESKKVDLTISDGRHFVLPQTISASGARYSNSDESFVFWNKGDTAFVMEDGAISINDCVIAPKNITVSQTANPASVNCLKVGGSLSIKKRGDGGEYGLCSFEENRACEEWALLRGECPVGGRKTTGFDTIDQSYCAWSGGQTLAVANSVCTFSNGSKCSTLDFYNGKCDKTSSVSPVVCTMDAMQCPDGSYVGRTGPECKFVCSK